MNTIPNIVSKEIISHDFHGEPDLYKVVLFDGKSERITTCSSESLRRLEILIILQEKGTDMDLIDELIEIVYSQGAESVSDY